MQYFEQLTHKYLEDLQIPIMQKRFNIRKDDPVEELHELYAEIKD